jgi:ATP-binding cassette subfamily F protein 3
LISVNNITKEFGGTPLFSGITFNLNDKGCVGLAGMNGSGKTTLLKIIANEIKPDTGTIAYPNDITIGYLPQEKEINSLKSIKEETLDAFKFINKLNARIAELNKAIQQRTDYHSDAYAKLLIELDELNHKLLIHEPDKLLANTEKVLFGLGFKQSDLDRPLTEFSFGWQMRVEIAKLLLLKPSLLLLDEPTNHLDIESIQWLEEFLSNYYGSILIVSHDRALLDNITGRTIEITNGKIYDYKVPYSKYVQLREERLSQQKAAYNNQQAEVRQVERFIERFRYKNTKSKQVQSRITHLEKLDRVELDEIDQSAIHFTFPPAPHSGKITVECKKISKSYEDKHVLDNINLEILKGDRIAFVGKNGEGKTTLAKIIAGRLDHLGDIKLGYQVQTGYFAQDQWEMLDAEKSVFETVDDIAVGDIRTRLKSILGAFLFQGDDIDKKVKVLSGGEKSRLSLAKLLLTPSNFLLFDEPTNHLDMRSKDILKNALLQFTGTLVIVSHDRDFLAGLTSKVYEFRNKGIKEYRGDIFEYLEKRKLEDLKELEIKERSINTDEKSVSDTKIKWEQKKAIEREKRKLEKKITDLEKDMGKLEIELESVNAKLADPSKYEDEIRSGSLYKEHDELTRKIEDVYSEWEKKQVQLEKMHADE